MLRWKGDFVVRALLRMDPRDALALLAIYSLIIGIACVGVAIGAFRQVVSAYWPRADGIITVSERSGKRGGSYWDLQYTYTVAGRKYTGTQYAYQPMDIQWETDLLSHMEAYPVGAAVVVYYKQSNPAEAVIRPGLRGDTRRTGATASSRAAGSACRSAGESSSNPSSASATHRQERLGQVAGPGS